MLIEGIPSDLGQRCCKGTGIDLYFVAVPPTLEVQNLLSPS